MITIISPQQQLFGRILALTGDYMHVQGYHTKTGQASVYDYLPDESANYPFVFIGEQYDTDMANKSAIFGNVTQTLHVYHDNPRKRGDLTAIMDDLKTLLRSIDKTANFYWHVTGMSGQVLPDNSTNVPLLHGVIEVTYRFN